MRARAGSVLPLVLAALAFAGLAAGGLLLLAARETSIGHISGDALRVRVAAEASARAAIAGWDRSTLPAVGPASPVPLPAGSGLGGGSLSVSATAERIGTALWIVRGEANVGPAGGTPPVARASAAALIVSVPPESPWAGFPAAFGSAGSITLDPGAVIDGNTASVIPPGWAAADCPPAAFAAGFALFGSPFRVGLALGPGAVVGGTGAVVAGSPPIQTGASASDSSAADWLFPLRFDEALSAPDRTEAGLVTPTPTVLAGSCDTNAPGNWGAPLDPAHPCHDYFPLIASPAAVTMGPGAGQGILLVDGDLTLLAGSVFYGAALVRGEVRSLGGVIHGAIRTLGAAAPLDLRVHASDCALWRAFERSPALRRAWRPPGRWWLPSAGL